MVPSRAVGLPGYELRLMPIIPLAQEVGGRAVEATKAAAHHGDRVELEGVVPTDYTVMTTLPRACPFPRYLRASIYLINHRFHLIYHCSLPSLQRIARPLCGSNKRGRLKSSSKSAVWLAWISTFESTRAIKP